MLASSITTSGPLPPISSSAALPAAACGDEPPGRGRADERDAVGPGVAGDLVADHRARPGHEVEHARRAGRRRRCTPRAPPRTPRSTAPASTPPRCRTRAPGAISSAGIVYGQFHGLITPTTPRGRRASITRLPGENEFGSSPPRRLASSAAIRQYSTSSSTSSNASARSGLPWSSVSVRARLVAARLDQVADRVHLRRALERGQPRPAVGGAARRVDRALASPRSPCGTVAITSPVAGLVASNVSPLALGCQLPPTNICCTV